MQRHFNSFEELVSFMENWSSWLGPDEAYDIGGLIAVFGACLTNLVDNGIEHDFGELAAYMDESQRKMLVMLARSISDTPAR